MKTMFRRAFRVFATLVLGAGMTSVQAIPQHPMDPLEDFEIMAAADILQNAGAALPTAIFQSIDLREPAKDVVLGFHAGDPLTRVRHRLSSARTRRATGRSSISTAGTFTPPVLIPASDGQLGLTIAEVSTLGFAVETPAVRNALALRGLDTPEKRLNVLVTPLTPGSFGLPEESHRIVKAQMYYTDFAGNQPVREADRGPAGHHRPRRPGRAASDRYRTVAVAVVRTQFRRGNRRSTAQAVCVRR